MDCDTIEGGWIPSAINFGATREAKRRGVTKTVPNVYEFLSTIPKIRSQEGQHAILNRFWDIQGHLLNPGLTAAQKRFVKAYARELKHHMTPATRKVATNEHKIMTTSKRIIKPTPIRGKAREARWNLFQDVALEPDNIPWLYNLNQVPTDRLNRTFTLTTEADELSRNASYKHAFNAATIEWRKQNPGHRGRLPMKQIHEMAKVIFNRHHAERLALLEAEAEAAMIPEPGPAQPAIDFTEYLNRSLEREREAAEVPVTKVVTSTTTKRKPNAYIQLASEIRKRFKGQGLSRKQLQEIISKEYQASKVTEGSGMHGIVTVKRPRRRMILTKMM